MFKLKRHLVPFSVIISLLATLCFVFAQETLTITTYYPSPYGSYQDLETGNLTFRNSTDGLVHFNYPGASPTYDRRLRITAGKDDITGNSQGASIDLHGVNATSYLGRLDLVAGQGSNVTFWTSPVGSGASERMRITAAGNVGIGTTTPGAKLDVFNPSGTSLTLAGQIQNLNNAANQNGLYINTARGGIFTDAYALDVRTLGTSALYVRSDRNVGIGTTNPNQGKVEVKGGTVCVDTNSDDNATSCIASECDARLKTNVKPIQGALNKILSLRGVEFDWKVNDPEIVKAHPLITRFADRPHSLGLISQEVEEVFPEAALEEINGFKQLKLEILIAPIIEAIKEQQKEINALKEELAQQKAEIASLKRKL